MTVKRTDFVAGQQISQVEMNQVQDNAVIQVDTSAERDSLPDTVMMCLQKSNGTVYKRVSGSWYALANKSDVDTVASDLSDDVDDVADDLADVAADLASLADSLNMSTNPLGSISMWWGTPAQVPAGWTICDGRKPSTAKWGGTVPDLRGRAVQGVSDNSVGQPTSGASIDGLRIGQVFGHDGGRFLQGYSHSYHNRARGYYGHPPDWDTTTSITHNHQHNIPVKSIGGTFWKSSAKWVYQGSPTSHGITGTVTSGHHHDLYMSPGGDTGATSYTYVTQPTAAVHFIIYVGVK